MALLKSNFETHADVAALGQTEDVKAVDWDVNKDLSNESLAAIANDAIVPLIRVEPDYYRRTNTYEIALDDTIVGG